MIADDKQEFEKEQNGNQRLGLNLLKSPTLGGNTGKKACKFLERTGSIG